jgi:hypothetical protein
MSKLISTDQASDEHGETSCSAIELKQPGEGWIPTLSHDVMLIRAILHTNSKDLQMDRSAGPCQDWRDLPRSALH